MKNNAVINVALSTELKEKVQQLAKNKNISLNSLVRLALTEFIEKTNKN